MKMRFWALSLCAGLLVSTGVMGQAICNGGTRITGKTNGVVFCRSNVNMNWWSAWTWCDSQNMVLADFFVMCPGTQSYPNNASGACPNLFKPSGNSGANIDSWSSLSVGNNAIAVRADAVTSNDSVHKPGSTYSYAKNSARRAFCMPR